MEPKKNFVKLEDESTEEKYTDHLRHQGINPNEDEGDDFSSDSPPLEDLPEDENQSLCTNKKGVKRRNLIALLMLLLMNFLYYISNGVCPYSLEDRITCTNYFRKMYPVWLLETIIVGLLWVLILILSIHRVFHRLWIPICLSNAVFIFFYKSGMEWKDHGGLNRFTFCCTIFILMNAYLFAMMFIKLWKKNIWLFVVAILGLLFSIFLFYLIQIKGSWNKWEEGLAGHKIDNSGAQCKVPFPTLWELSIRNEWLDFSKFTNTWENTKTIVDRSVLPKNLSEKKNLYKIGFPRIENYPEEIKLNQYLFRDTVRENLIDMDDPDVSEKIKEKVEFVIDISDSDKHKLEISLKKNHTRAEEQKKLRKEIIDKEKREGIYERRIDKNMLVLYIDNLSRAHFMRKMPKTAEWLAQFVENEEEDIKTYQFFRYHTSYFNTLYANGGLYYGDVSHVEDTSTNVFNSYSENGYITGFFKDSWETVSVSIKDTDPHTHKWDHFGGEISCDFNYDTTTYKSLTVFEGKASAIRHCLYSQNMHEIQMEYLKQFWAAYPENRKFFRTHFSEPHELTGELVQYMDKDLRDLLQFFLNEGYLEDTMITLVSDHGAHALTLRFPGFPDNSRYLENYYPLLFHVVKSNIPEASLHYLQESEQSFISTYDIYSNLKTIADNKLGTTTNDTMSGGVNRGRAKAQSYAYAFEAIPNERDCSNKHEYIASCWCDHDLMKLENRMKEIGIFYAKF
jgi:hypothetical protein